MELYNHYDSTIHQFFELVSGLDLVDGNLTDLGFNEQIAFNAFAELVFGVQTWTLHSEILKELRTLGLDWSKWCASSEARFRSWLRALITVHDFYDLEITDEDFVVFSAKYVIASLNDVGEEFLKYQTNYLACRLFEQQEFPERPISLPVSEKSGVIFHKLYRRTFHKLWRHSRRLQFGYSIIQFKRGCLPVSEVKQAKAVSKHCRTLGTPSGTKVSRFLQEEISRTVNEVLGKRQSGTKDKLLAPSTSAHYESARSEFGSLPIVQEKCTTICSDHGSNVFSLFTCNCWKWLIYDKDGESFMDSRFFGPPPSDHLKRELLWSTVFDEKTFNTCEVHMVLEAMKVRPITAGNSEMSYLGRYLQKRIHARVGKHPVFEFTHKPASFASIRGDIGTLKDDQFLVSADYEAATDNLHGFASKVAWTACAKWCADSRDEYQILNQFGSDMLCGQVLNYRKSIVKIFNSHEFPLYGPWSQEAYSKLSVFGIKESTIQQRGQLMGCILSFFLLCMINAAAVRSAYEKVYKRKFSLKSLPLKINGDDALFRCNSDVIKEWSVIANQLGLKPSLGQNFVSKEFAMINSEMYEYTLQDGQRVAKSYLPYMNLGLLMGVGRVQEDTRVTAKFINGTDKYGPIGARSRDLIKGWSVNRSRRLINLFVDFNRSTLLQTSRGWGVPEGLGGLGIPYIDNHSDLSCVVAAYLDRLDIKSYSEWITKITSSDLKPPTFVQKAISLQNDIKSLLGDCIWGTEQDAAQNELPLLTGGTWLHTNIIQISKKDMYRENAEYFYKQLEYKAIRSGVVKKSYDQLQHYVGKYKYVPTDESVRNQLNNWIPEISRFF